MEDWMIGGSDGVQDSVVARADSVGHRIGSIRFRYRKGGRQVHVEFKH